MPISSSKVSSLSSDLIERILLRIAASEKKRTALDVLELTPFSFSPVEFYFSDVNLPYDQFLFQLACERLPLSKSPLGTGWVPISTITSFKRMRPFQSHGIERIADALRKSPKLLKVSADGTTVRRLTTLQPPGDDLIERSSYAKGFPNWPEEEPDRKAKEDELQPRLEAFFAQFGPVRAVRMRREGGPMGAKGDARKSKTLKRFKVSFFSNRQLKHSADISIPTLQGSIFVEWETKEAAEEFNKRDPPPKFEGEVEPLTIMSK
jgi:hypothetical protein